MWGDGTADGLTVDDKEVVDGDPVSPWEYFPKGCFGRSWIGGRQKSPSVHDAMNMGVHTDSGLSKTQGDHQVRGLPPHAFQGEQLVDLVRNFAREPGQDLCADLPDGLRLGPVESRRVNRPSDGFLWYLYHPLGVIGQCKEPGAGLGSHLVFRPQTDDAGNQDAIWIVPMVLGYFGDGSRTNPISMGAEHTENRRQVIRFHIERLP